MLATTVTGPTHSDPRVRETERQRPTSPSRSASSSPSRSTSLVNTATNGPVRPRHTPTNKSGAFPPSASWLNQRKDRGRAGAHPGQRPLGLLADGFVRVLQQCAYLPDVLGVADDRQRAERLGAHPRQLVGEPRRRGLAGAGDVVLGGHLQTHLGGRQCSSASPATTADVAVSSQTCSSPRAPQVRTQ